MALLLAAVLFLFLVQASVIGQDDYVLAPGSATDTAPAVLVEGAPTFDPEGEIAFTTVTIKRNVTVWEWLRARRDSASELVPAEQIDGSRTADETRQVTQFQMDQSQDTATLVALNFLGYEIVPEVEGAFVVQLVDDSPAQAVLRLGDLITDVNGTPVRSSEDLGDTIRSFEPGDEVVVSLRRAREGGRDGSDENAEELDFTIVLAENAQNPDAGFLGVQIQTPVRADAPFDVGFDVGRVRGPSAGLAFSLAIVDVLSEGELTGGNKVATTGTIDAGGNVGAVGGVPQKIEAAKRADVQLFLVPPSEYEDAIAAAGDDIDVLCVQTFDDAILALAEIGGNGVETAEAFGAPAPQRSPNPVNPDDGFLSCAEVIGAQVADR
jgi:PDZ domain-containing protein